ncbi:MAG: leucine-rich repeat domain-containing protein [Rivularia sp. (in: cyanobacteria)]
MSELNQNKSFNYSSFSEFCFHKDELPAETRHTVEELLRVAGTDDCLEAEKVLLNETVLYLEISEITDLSPLATLPNLICLYLSENDISDLTPLQSLTNLRSIDLQNNQISDITPLQTLINVDELMLFDNHISDISPLSKLTKLIKLWLPNNQITNIQPLSKLINIEEINLSDNRINDIRPLQRLVNIEWLCLANNQIKNITPLEKLIKLEYLDIDENHIIDVKPLDKLINLSCLLISNNQITNLNSIVSLNKLYTLDVGFNKIQDFDSLKIFKDVIINISGNPFSGLLSPNHLIDKYKKILSVPLNHQKATETVTLAYVNAGLEPPKVIVTSNYKSLYAEAINFLKSNNNIKNSEDKGGIKHLLNQANINILHNKNFQLKKIVILQLIEREFNNSQFIRQLNLISQAIQFHLNPEELSLLYNDGITTQDIIHQIYLIEVYQSLLNISLDEKTQQWYDCLNQLFEHCGWFIPFEDVCIVCVKRSSTEGNRPSKFSLDSETRLHAEGEAAIQFADGYGLYYYHGVALPEKYGKVHPDRWQAICLLEEKNTELRRILIQAIGYNRICKELKAIQLDSFREYMLIKIDAVSNVEPIVLLKMICPSTGYTHVLRVPPNMESAREAITWVNWDIDPQEFAVES